MADARLRHCCREWLLVGSLCSEVVALGRACMWSRAMWRGRSRNPPAHQDAAFYDPQHPAPVVKRPRAGAAAAHVFPKRLQSCSRSLPVRFGFHGRFP